MEGAVGILKTTIAMEQRVGIMIRLYSTVKGLENQWVVIAITYDISNKATVIEIQDCTEIYFVYLNTLIPFELRNVGKPFLVGLVRIELAVKEVFGYIQRILCLPRKAVVAVLDGGLDASGSANTENSFVVYMDVFIVTQVVVDASIAFVWALHVDLLHLLRDLLVLHDPGTQLPRSPTKVGGSGNVQQFTGCLNRIVLLCLAFLHGSV